MKKELAAIIKLIESADLSCKVRIINEVREALHDVSPFKNEPVDFVKWVAKDTVVANDYNPNKVAPPEMQLLEVSILNDGYTQPIVTFPHGDCIEVVDGFHRSRVGKESELVAKRINGYLPVVSIRSEKSDRSSRIASTIRHNRARGKHQVSTMSEIVIELKNRNWNNKRIARELGMDEDEILRLCQVSGLEDMFKDHDFNMAWVSDGCTDDFIELTDDVTQEDMSAVRIPLELDLDRIFHTFDRWEAVEYGFYDSTHPTMTQVQCEYKYKEVLSDPNEFDRILKKITDEWINSCEHNLTNKALNRIAWLGQAAVAYKYKVPSKYSSGWQLLAHDEQLAANEVALAHLNRWLESRNIAPVSMEEATQVGRQVELY